MTASEKLLEDARLERLGSDNDYPEEDEGKF